MRYPDFLHKKECIGFPAPSFGCATEPYKSCFDSALEFFGFSNYLVKEGKNSRLSEGIGISNTPKKCAEELMEMYASDETKVLISCGGGELMCEILDELDFEVFKNSKPKWFMGYSDNTNFIFPLVTICDTAAIYGPHAGAFISSCDHIPQYLLDSLNILCGTNDEILSYDKYEKDSLKSEENPLAGLNATEPSIKSYYYQNALIKGDAFDGNFSFSGRMIGGCMDCLEILIGTSYDGTSDFVKKYASDGIIWCFEACELNVFSIRRTLWHMEHSGWFEKGIVSGFIFGRPRAGEDMFGLDRFDAVLNVVKKYDCPVIFDADLGHLPPMMPIVMGAIGHVSVKGNDIKIKYEFA